MNPQTTMLAHEEAAQGFAAVGSEPRLSVLLALVRAGPAGLTVGEIQGRVGFAPSTLAHHLKFLAAGGLIQQERRGRAVISRADYERIKSLAGFLLRECCADVRASVRGGQDRTGKLAGEPS